MQRLLGELAEESLGDPEVDELGQGAIPGERGDEDVRGLDVAVQDPALVGVLESVAELGDELHPLFEAEAIPVTIDIDRNPVDVLHHEIGLSALRGARVENLSDVGVAQACEGLPFGLESGEDLPVVRSRLDDLEGDLALHGLGLLGEEDGAHAALAQGVQDAVGADRTRSFRDRVARFRDGGRIRRDRVGKDVPHPPDVVVLLPEFLREVGVLPAELFEGRIPVALDPVESSGKDILCRFASIGMSVLVHRRFLPLEWFQVP